jgi:transposase
MMTREAFQQLYDQGPDAVYAVLVAMQAQIDALTARVAELEARLNKDSHNSSRPPSSDGLRRGSRPPRSLRGPSDRPSGGQPGHPGQTLLMVAEPDQRVCHEPAVCAGCGAPLAGGPMDLEAERRQVFDLPPVRLEVTEHRVASCVCPHCQTLNRGAFPPAVSQSAQYGPRLLAQALLLNQWHLLPLARTCQVLGELCGARLSEGALVHAIAVNGQRLAPIEEGIKEAVGAAPVVHFDETGVRTAGRLHWCHVASTRTLTFYAHHARRGRAAFQAIGLLPKFVGVRVRDALSCYDDPSYGGQSALCNAHLLRELVGGWEDWRQTWCLRLIVVLLRLKSAVEAARAAGRLPLDPLVLAHWQQVWRRTVARGLAEHPLPPPTGRRGRPQRGKARCLLDRLAGREADILRFAVDFRVPFDNNQAERDLRMVKVHQKVSGCFRTPAGAASFCRLRGYLSTVAKQGLNLLDALTALCEGTPLWPCLQPG